MDLIVKTNHVQVFSSNIWHPYKMKPYVTPYTLKPSATGNIAKVIIVMCQVIFESLYKESHLKNFMGLVMTLTSTISHSL